MMAKNGGDTKGFRQQRENSNIGDEVDKEEDDSWCSEDFISSRIYFIRTFMVWLEFNILNLQIHIKPLWLH